MDALKHLPQVLWRTWVRDVVFYGMGSDGITMLFECSVKPIDINDKGTSDPILDSFLLIDYIGHIYKITSVNGLYLIVSDIFRTNECPQNCQQGIVVKPVWNGRALYIAPTIMSHLHEQAKSYIDSLNYDIIWSNDSNAERIAYYNTNNPSIENYHTEFSDDYGDSPMVRLVVTLVNESGITYESYRTEMQCNELDESGNITRIHFGELDNNYTGYMIISKT